MNELSDTNLFAQNNNQSMVDRILLLVAFCMIIVGRLFALERQSVNLMSHKKKLSCTRWESEKNIGIVHSDIVWIYEGF